MCKVEKNELILSLQILKEFVYDVDSPWLGEFLQSVYEKFPSNIVNESEKP